MYFSHLINSHFSERLVTIFRFQLLHFFLFIRDLISQNFFETLKHKQYKLIVTK